MNDETKRLAPPELHCTAFHDLMLQPSPVEKKDPLLLYKYCGSLRLQNKIPRKLHDVQL